MGRLRFSDSDGSGNGCADNEQIADRAVVIGRLERAGTVRPGRLDRRGVMMAAAVMVMADMRCPRRSIDMRTAMPGQSMDSPASEDGKASLKQERDDGDEAMQERTHMQTRLNCRNNVLPQA